MVLGRHLVCGTKNANDMGMVLSKHWRYSTWCSCITGHFIQAKLWYHPSCNWGHPSFGQSPMVWNGHCRDSASISSGGLQLCIFPCSWLQWDCDSRIYLLYLLLKFGLWYVVVLSNLTTFAQGYASFASLQNWCHGWIIQSPLPATHREVSDFQTSSFTIVDSPESRRWGRSMAHGG